MATAPQYFSTGEALDEIMRDGDSDDGDLELDSDMSVDSESEGEGAIDNSNNDDDPVADDRDIASGKLISFIFRHCDYSYLQYLHFFHVCASVVCVCVLLYLYCLFTHIHLLHDS